MKKCYFTQLITSIPNENNSDFFTKSYTLSITETKKERDDIIHELSLPDVFPKIFHIYILTMKLPMGEMIQSNTGEEISLLQYTKDKLIPIDLNIRDDEIDNIRFHYIKHC